MRRFRSIFIALPLLCIFLLGLSLVASPTPNVLYDYQTLVTGILALGSAIWAGLLVRQQMAQAGGFEQKRIESKRETSRAMLPMALTELTRYANECGAFVIAFGDREPGVRLVTGAPTLEPPPVPTSALLMLKELAEYVEPAERLFLARIISAIQILSSRLASMIESPRSHPQPTLDDYLIDAAEVRARVDVLYGWARYEEDAAFPISITAQPVHDAAHSMQLRGRVAEPERVEDTILRRAKGNLASKLRDR